MGEVIRHAVANRKEWEHNKNYKPSLEEVGSGHLDSGEKEAEAVIDNSRPTEEGPVMN